MDGIVKDLQYSLRTMQRQPGFTAVVVLTLAIGIAANTTIFSMVNAIFLRPLPVPDADRLVTIYRQTERSQFGAHSYPTFLDLRDQLEGFDDVAAAAGLAVDLNLRDRNETQSARIVSGNYFDVVGIRPAAGRFFLPEEDATPLRYPVVVISHDLWRSRFQEDPAVIGGPLRVNGETYTVVGVTPPGFRGLAVGGDTQLWFPMAMQQQVRPPSPRLRRFLGSRDLLQGRPITWMVFLGRFEEGSTLARARAAVDVVGSRLHADHPDLYDERPFHVVSIGDGTGLRRDSRASTRLLLLAVGFVLLIACANVANLLLARGQSRRKELSMRLALGAGRGRIVRQLLTESLLLAGAGGLLALWITSWSRDVLYFFDIPESVDLALDGRVLVFTLGLIGATALLFGLVPALRSSDPKIASVLQDETATVAGRAGARRLRGALVVAQVALSMILLVGAGLLLRSLRNGLEFDPGFDVDRVAVARLDLDRAGYDETEGAQLCDRLMERVRALPGVEAASLARIVPLSGVNRTGTLTGIDGRDLDEPEQERLYQNVVGVDYFRTLGIPLVLGRTFHADDDAGRPPVAIVTTELARRLPTPDPIGHRLRLGDTEWIEIVGVVETTKLVELREGDLPVLYLPIAQGYESIPAVHLRSAGDPGALLPVLQSVVRELDPDINLFGMQTLADELERSLSRERMVAGLLSIFGFTALLLAAVGIYGVISYGVGERTHEVGIRMALGARAQDILRLVVGGGLGLAALGIGIGVLGALALGRLTSEFLFEVTPGDPSTLAAIAAALFLVALLAAWIPARRAARVDPMRALRQH